MNEDIAIEIPLPKTETETSKTFDKRAWELKKEINNLGYIAPSKKSNLHI